MPRRLLALAIPKLLNSITAGVRSSSEEKTESRLPTGFGKLIQNCIVSSLAPEQMKIIEVKPVRGGWKVFEMRGVEPVFPKRDQALDYANTRQGFGQGEIHVVDAASRIVEKIS